MNTPPLLIAGSGKLARELLAGLAPDARPWRDRTDAVRAVVHAGSGRELQRSFASAVNARCR